MSKNKEASACDAVLSYLRSQNRPYSVNDIVLNLHKEHGKTAVQKAVDKLVQEDKVREKTYGKQKVYLINQTGIPEASPEEMKKMDQEIEQKERRLKEIETNVKVMQAELKALSSSMSTEEARALVHKLTKENAELKEKYSALASNNIPCLSKEEREAIRSRRRFLMGEWRRRKGMCMSGINGILEDWPETKKALYEQVGIETDEDVGVELLND